LIEAVWSHILANLDGDDKLAALNQEIDVIKDARRGANVVVGPLRALLAGLLAALALAASARAADPAGDWTGVITVGPTATYRLAVHIWKATDGAYAGSYDSFDRGVYGSPLAEIAVARDQLSFAAPSVAGRYAGQWDPVAGRWVGQWTLAGRAFPLSLSRGVFPAAPVVAGLDGEWDGSLFMGAGLNLRLAFHIKTGPHGTLATLDSVDQGAYGASVSSISRQGEHVRLEMKALNAVFDATLADGGQTLVGVFAQAGSNLPLTLKRLPPGAPSPWPAPSKPPPPDAPPADWKPPSDAEIRKLLADRIDVQHEGVGIVVGVIDGTGRRVVAYGRSDPGDPRPLNGDTEFEIGSITKVFTSLVLADMVRGGAVKLDDPAAKYLPAGVKMPERNGAPIRLVDLDTHTSGLPRMPSNFAPKDPANPYADYSVDQLYQFLAGYQLPRDPGAKWEYSNLGMGLLGQLLARRAGMDYEALVKAKVLGPLGMTSTTITLTPEEAGRLAVGHDAHLARTAAWDLPTLDGAGGLRSTANDLLTFLAANLGYADTPLKEDMAFLLTVRRPTGSPNLSQALGWEALSTPAGEIVQHGGGTGGYHTLIAFNPKARAGVVVLTNAETVMGADDIGLHILTGSPVASLAPPSPPPAPRQAITLPPEVLQRYVGRYQLTPKAVVTVTRIGEHLFAQLALQANYEIFPETRTGFFWKVVDAQATFQLGLDGAATGLVLHQNGRDLTAPRIAEAGGPAPASLAPADVSGTWAFTGTIEASGQIVTTAPVCVFQQASGRLTGDCKGPNGVGPATGTVDGRRVSWRWDETADTPSGASGRASFDGTLGSDGVLRGQVTFSGVATPGTFTGQRR
jgi:serine-type D-Ala-D-Ala carboxypeptidase/endopeptidase